MDKSNLLYSAHTIKSFAQSEILVYNLNNMSKNIITISRQFGSGGRTIAKTVAEKLDIPFYDKDIIAKIVQQSGLSEEFVIENGEYATNGQHVLFHGYGPNGFAGFTSAPNVFDQLYAIQYGIILDIAADGPCVILGRCADYVLRDRNDCLNVYIKAKMEDRIARVESNKTSPIKDIKKFLTDRDKKRKTYYKYNTDRNWGESKNYDLVLDSSSLGIDACVEMICLGYKS